VRERRVVEGVVYRKHRTYVDIDVT